MAAEITERRRLAAIMFTDMVGYSALANRDETTALELLDEQRQTLRAIFPTYGGREVDVIGDGFLLEFASALEATRCAVEIQRRLAERNALAAPHRHFALRIGIHLGDVLERGRQLAGDSVNIAARLEPLASPGGICMTRAVHDQIANKLPERIVPLGLVELKNISEGVEVFRIEMASRNGGETGSQPSRPSPPRQTRPKHPIRVAVLPFVNMSSDPKNEFVTDGLTEELITSLSLVPGLSIPGRTSVFAFKDHRADIRRIGRALNVDKVLEGSMRISGQRFRITAQLIDAQDGFHLWSQRYDGKVKDSLEMQDEITSEIVEALEAILIPGRCPPVGGGARRACLAPSARPRVCAPGGSVPFTDDDSLAAAWRSRLASRSL